MTALKDLIARFKSGLEQAERTGLHLPNGGTLATVGPDGMPSGRVVLLKDVDERGFVFYTNLESRKARELAANPRASLCFWWPPLEQQVRIEGAVETVPGSEADGYWVTRPRGSQIGAWASRQSEPLASRADLVAEFERVRALYEGKPIPRPPFWSGYCLVPQRIEFWHGREDRLHERDLYTRTSKGWEKSFLSP
jgi:pyridoxamine 5'-phosphate oxidase